MAPFEYDVIRQAHRGFRYIPADFIEYLSYISLNPIFREKEFREALIEYRKYGMNPPYPKEHTLSDEIKYIRYKKQRNAELAALYGS